VVFIIRFLLHFSSLYKLNLLNTPTTLRLFYRVTKIVNRLSRLLIYPSRVFNIRINAPLIIIYIMRFSNSLVVLTTLSIV